MSEFKSIFQEVLAQFDFTLDQKATDRFCRYYDLLIEWNEKINLTALTEPRDVALKHFVDSLMLLRYTNIGLGASVIDVGTGAGFPGLALKIARPDIKLTLLDSLQKRLTFLDEVSEALALDDVVTVHSRAEDGARTILFRDRYDVATARAVAPLNVLCEYCMPYVSARDHQDRQDRPDPCAISAQEQSDQKEAVIIRNGLNVSRETFIRHYSHGYMEDESPPFSFVLDKRFSKHRAWFDRKVVRHRLYC